MNILTELSFFLLKALFCFIGIKIGIKIGNHTKRFVQERMRYILSKFERSK